MWTHGVVQTGTIDVDAIRRAMRGQQWSPRSFGPKAQINKTVRNDARGIAQTMRAGFPSTL